jgi:hypothetical protein
MTTMLQEFCDSRGVEMRVDRQKGVIRGVKVLGLESRNGRSYLPEALAQAAALYEDAKVNVNHAKGNPNAPRDYQDRIGAIRNVAVRAGEGLFGDFCFNPKHALAEQLLWDAEHAPENVGFSHNVEARVGRRGERVGVEAITRVASVDLVADPATTRGLFESAAAITTGPSAKGDSAIFADHDRPTPTICAAKIGTGPTLEELRRDYPELIEAIRREQAAELRRLEEEVDRLATLDVAHRRQTAVRLLLHEFHLPNPETGGPGAKAIVSQPFVDSLLAAPDEQAVRALVEERARLVQTLAGGDATKTLAEARPLSRDQHLVDAVGALSGKSFVDAIT